MKAKEINAEEFVELFSNDIYCQFRETLRNTELCGGTFKGSYKDDDGNEHPYSCAYRIWYDIENGLLTWQFGLGLNETDKALAPQIEQWLVDVVNDDLTLSLEINA